MINGDESLAFALYASRWSSVMSERKGRERNGVRVVWMKRVRPRVEKTECTISQKWGED